MTHISACESYNIDEHCSTNHYNCRVVDIIRAVESKYERLTEQNFLMPYIDLNMRANTVKKASHQYSKNTVLIKTRIANGLDEGFAALKLTIKVLKNTAGQHSCKRPHKEVKQVIILQADLTPRNEIKPRHK